MERKFRKSRKFFSIRIRSIRVIRVQRITCVIRVICVLIITDKLSFNFVHQFIGVVFISCEVARRFQGISDLLIALRVFN